MEVLGIAASVVAVVQLTGACLKLSKKWLGPSEFSTSELDTMIADLYAFNGVLRTFQTHLEIHSDDEPRILGLNHLTPVLHRCEGALTTIQEFMERSGVIGRYLLAPRFDRKLKLSLQILERAKGLLELAVSADSRTILAEVGGCIRNVDECVHQIHSLAEENRQNLADMSQAQLAHFQRTELWMDEQDAKQKREERQAILDWITPLDYTPQQNDLLDKRQAGTGKWLLESPTYTTWVAKADAEHRTLFCKGIPGSGKTILTATVIEDLRKRFESEPTVGVVYIYFNFRRHFEQEPKQLLSSLLKQLLQHQAAIPDNIRSLYSRHHDKGARPTMGDVLTALRAVSLLFSRIFVVVDALDECQSVAGYRSLFLAELDRLQEDKRFGCFLTSRNIPDIEALFAQCPSLEILASNEDIDIYIEGRMHHLPPFIPANAGLKRQIKREIIAAVDGMFLLAQLYLTSLEDKATIKAVKKALSYFKEQTEQAPTEQGKSKILALAYDQAMERIQGQREGFRQLAQRVLAWIACATRPLSATELQHALAVELGERSLDAENIPEVSSLASVCSGLVTVDKESNVVRLIHYTTQEYFNRTRDRWFPTAEVDVCITCVTYLSFDAFSGGFSEHYTQYRERLASHPLYMYAAHNWTVHARSAGANESPGGGVALIETSKPVLDFLERAPNVEAAMQVLAADAEDPARVVTSKTPRKTTGLHFVAREALDGALRTLLEMGHDPNARDSHGRTPLCYATQRGHLSTAQTLLSHAQTDINIADSEGMTPLMHAAMANHTKALVLTDTIVASTARNLIDIDHQDNRGRTLLLRSAKSRHWTFFRRLIDEHGADPTIADEFGQTALAFAVEAGETDIVEALLEIEGVDASSVDVCGLTPYALACCWHRSEILVLLEKKLEKDGRSVPPFTALLHPGSTKRVLREVRELAFDPPEHVLPVMCKGNIAQWSGFIRGPIGTPYENGSFGFSVQFPNDYPFKPPRITFSTLIKHPNIIGGVVLVSMLRDEWSPAYNISVLMLSIVAMLGCPALEKPLSEEAESYLLDPEAYNRSARDWTKKYAYDAVSS